MRNGVDGVSYGGTLTNPFALDASINFARYSSPTLGDLSVDQPTRPDLDPDPDLEASSLDVPVSAIRSPSCQPLFEMTYDDWRETYFVKVEDGSAYVYVNVSGDVEPADAVTASEAIGYGALISVLAGRRDDFDALIAWYDAHQNANGLMCWQQVHRDGRTRTNPDFGDNSATDGDMDVTLALLMATDVWGDTAGYRERAARVSAALLTHCVCPDTGVLALGDWALRGGRDNPYFLIARPSDFLFDHMARFAIDLDPAWKDVAGSCYGVLVEQVTQHSPCGLVADFIRFDETRCGYVPVVGGVLERSSDGDFSYNSCRLAWRLALSLDERVRELLDGMFAFFVEHLRASDIVDGRGVVLAATYTMTGEPTCDYTHMAMLASVWCMLHKLGRRNDADRLRVAMKWLREVGYGGYYGDTIFVLARLQANAEPSTGRATAA